VFKSITSTPLTISAFLTPLGDHRPPGRRRRTAVTDFHSEADTAKPDAVATGIDGRHDSPLRGSGAARLRRSAPWTRRARWRGRPHVQPDAPGRPRPARRLQGNRRAGLRSRAAPVGADHRRRRSTAAAGPPALPAPAVACSAPRAQRGNRKQATDSRKILFVERG
jgi:hypothetical protein